MPIFIKKMHTALHILKTHKHIKWL